MEEDEQIEVFQMEADFQQFEAQEAMKDWATQVYAAKWILKQLDEKVPTKIPLLICRCIMTPTSRPDPHLENVLRRMPDAPAAQKKVTSKPG